MKRKNKIFAIIKTVTAATLLIHLINKVISSSAALLTQLDYYSGKKKYCWRFGDVFYIKKGTGTPLLLIHDLHPGASGYEWSKTEDTLARNHTLYILDLPGCGRSDKPNITYTNFLFVQLLCDFIKEVIGEKTEILTSGYSGSLAVMAVQYDKDCISSLKMINPTDISVLSKTPDCKDKLLRCAMVLPVFGTFLYHIAMCKANIENEFVEHYFFNPFHLDGDMMDAYYESSHKKESAGKYLYASLKANYIHMNIVPALTKLEIPVEIYMGEAEPNAKYIANLYTSIQQGISVRYIPNSKHFPHMENADAFLEEFL